MALYWEGFRCSWKSVKIAINEMVAQLLKIINNIEVLKYLTKFKKHYIFLEDMELHCSQYLDRHALWDALGKEKRFYIRIEETKKKFNA